VSLTEVPELHVDGGLPGFPGATRFALVRWGGDDSPFSLLRSLDDPDLSFVVVPPAVFFPHYEPEIDDEVAEELDLQSAEEALLLVIVTLGATASEATANLLGPVVVNQRTLAALQTVLSTGGHGTRVPLVA
jgi:flagellar assembly factor FliW